MGIDKDLKTKAMHTREDGVFTLKLDEGISLAKLSSFAQDMFPGVSLDEIGVWPAEDGELVGLRPWRRGGVVELNGSVGRARHFARGRGPAMPTTGTTTRSRRSAWCARRPGVCGCDCSSR